MRHKIVYNMANGLEEKAYENPRKRGDYIFPGGCIEEAPPEFDKELQICSYVNESWVVKDKPKPENLELEEASSEPEFTLVDSTTQVEDGTLVEEQIEGDIFDV